MRLNTLEFALMNNPVRAAVQRHVEARRLLCMAGPMRGGKALEIGSGRGIGAALILDVFGADVVDAFDLDPPMVALVRERLRPRGSRVHLWVTDAAAIPAASATYDAVFDFGIIHHVTEWRLALREVHRVLKPGGRFYAEEILASFIGHPIARRLLDHPKTDRFDAPTFGAALQETGLTLHTSEQLWGAVAWFAAEKASGGPTRG